LVEIKSRNITRRSNRKRSTFRASRLDASITRPSTTRTYAVGGL